KWKYARRPRQINSHRIIQKQSQPLDRIASRTTRLKKQKKKVEREYKTTQQKRDPNGEPFISLLVCALRFPDLSVSLVGLGVSGGLVVRIFTGTIGAEIGDNQHFNHGISITRK
ncbi:hypothetical protein CUMW_003290, partial [Citrus unshiu]